MKDIARILDVSVVTVSKSLNNKFYEIQNACRLRLKIMKFLKSNYND
jgi:DNA-binding LacI/PurR family transcriptional regulator